MLQNASQFFLVKLEFVPNLIVQRIWRRLNHTQTALLQGQSNVQRAKPDE
jgi:hypothetical protein